MSAYVFIDVSKKQEYIFKNNKLRDNILNSVVIKSVTEIVDDFKEEDMMKIYGNENKTEIPEFSKFNLTKCLLQNTDVNVNGYLGKVYSGGGNSILKFDSPENAKDFIRNYSCEILKRYPDLELYMSMVEHEESQGGVSDMDIRSKLIALADRQKDARKSRFRRWSYGIEKIDETGMPVAYEAPSSKGGKGKLDDEPDNQKKQDEEEIRAARIAKKFLVEKLEKRLEGTNIKTTYKMSDYKRKNGKNSYVGVISIDGNKMGHMVSKIGSFEELGYFSRILDLIYTESVASALESMNGANSEYGENVCHGGYGSGAKAENGMLVTPVVMAGDDICLVVQSELAIELAAGIIKNIEGISKKLKEEDFSSIERYIKDSSKAPGDVEHEIEKMNKVIENTMDGIEFLSACGGVSIVKAGYPFFESVKNAEKMCHSAKEQIHRIERNGNSTADASFMDWNIVKGSVMTEKAYESHVGYEDSVLKYHIKPLRISHKYDKSDDVKGYGTENRIFWDEDSKTFSYEGFMDIAGKLKASVSSNSDGVSASSLQKIKGAMYSGPKCYNLTFEMDRTGDLEKIGEIVKKEVEKGRGNTNNEKLKCENGVIENAKESIYILNDIIEALDFI